MHVRILGSAAGGGLPQWNCRCSNCSAVRAGAADIRARSQSSVAVSADRRHWFLLNVSPDVRQQLLASAELAPPVEGQRGSPIVGCVLTDAELDHCSGLLFLREGPSFNVFCTARVRGWLERDLPIVAVLREFCRPTWIEVTCDSAIDLPLRDGAPSGLRLRIFEVDGTPPRFVRESEQPSSGGRGSCRADSVGGAAGSAGASPSPAAGAVIGLEITDRHTDGKLVYAPCIAEIAGGLVEAVRDAGAVLLDGTFWDDDEPVRSGIGQRTAREMGHLPVSGPDGSLAWLRSLPVKNRMYVHINNTNPMLRERGPEFRQVVDAGVRVAADGDSFDTEN